VLPGLSNLSNVEDNVDSSVSRPVRDIKVSCNTTYSSMIPIATEHRMDGSGVERQGTTIPNKCVDAAMLR